MFDLKAFLPKNKRVLVISAAPFDGDSLASGTILTKYIQSLGFETLHYFPREISAKEKEFLGWLPYFEEITFGDTRQFFEKGKDSTTLVTVDGRDKIQFYDYKNEKLPPPDFTNISTILRMHHHTLPDNDITKNLVGGAEYSSTSEVILTHIIPREFINHQLANCGYAGIVDDTGNFQWNFTSQTLSVASWLCTFGIDAPSISSWVMHVRDEEFYKALSYAVERIHYYPEIRTILLPLSKEEQIKDKLTPEFNKSLIAAFNTELAKRIRGYDRGILLLEQDKHVKVTGRGQSTNKISLAELLRPVGSLGKGHFNATDFETKQDFGPIEQKIIKVVKRALWVDS